MSRIEAAIDDLGRLAEDIGRLDEQLQSTNLRLDRAIDAAWATSGPFLPAPSELPAEIDAHRRRCRETADATVAAARRLRQAGGDGALQVANTATSSPAIRLAAALLAEQGASLAARSARWLQRAFVHAPAQPDAPYLVTTTTEVFGLDSGVEAEATIVRDEFSDGSVRITEVTEVSDGTGVSLGLSCDVAVDGHRRSMEAAVSASLGLHGSAGQTWVFADRAAADRWWNEHRTELRLEALASLTPMGGPLRSALGTLIPGLAPLPAADERYEELGTDAGLHGRVAVELGQAALDAGAESTVRHNHDGTVTVTIAGSMSVEAGFAVADRNGRQPSAAAAVDAALSVTLSAAGEIQQVHLNSVTLDEPGLDQTLAGALDPSATGASRTGSDGWHVYETDVALDLTDPEVRSLVQFELGIDLDQPMGQLQAALGALTLDARLVRASRITVLEKTQPEDHTWEAGCSVDLPGVSGGSFDAVAGRTEQHTVATWQKSAGRDELVPLPR